MSQVVVTFDPDVGVSPADVASERARDDQARALGTASAVDSIRADSLSHAVVLVMVPPPVNVASSSIYDLLRRLVTRLHTTRREEPGLEFIKVLDSKGNRIFAVRLRRARA